MCIPSFSFHVVVILGDPGAASRDDAIFSDERHFWRESLFQGLKSSSALQIETFTPKMSLARKYRIVPTSSPWVSEDVLLWASIKLWETSYFNDTLRHFRLAFVKTAKHRRCLELDFHTAPRTQNNLARVCISAPENALHFLWRLETII